MPWLLIYCQPFLPRQSPPRKSSGQIEVGRSALASCHQDGTTWWRTGDATVWRRWGVRRGRPYGVGPGPAAHPGHTRLPFPVLVPSWSLAASRRQGGPALLSTSTNCERRHSLDKAVGSTAAYEHRSFNGQLLRQPGRGGRAAESAARPLASTFREGGNRGRPRPPGRADEQQRLRLVPAARFSALAQPGYV